VFQYKVKADRDVIVEGLAVLYADQEQTFSEYDEQQFFNMRGIRLNQDNVPAGVQVTIVVVPDVKLDEDDAKYLQEEVA
jgi:hypothetical protein